MDTEKLLQAYDPPFYCDKEGGMILDQKQNVIVQVRGWSNLRSKFGDQLAFELQIQIGNFVADKLNEVFNPSVVFGCDSQHEKDEEDGPTEEDIEDERDRKYFNGSSYEDGTQFDSRG